MNGRQLLVIFLLIAGAGLQSGCRSFGRSPEIARKKSGISSQSEQNGAILPVQNEEVDQQESAIQPIGTEAALPRRSWINSLNPFHSKKKRMPLPLSKKIDGDVAEESIHAF